MNVAPPSRAVPTSCWRSSRPEASSTRSCPLTTTPASRCDHQVERAVRVRRRREPRLIDTPDDGGRGVEVEVAQPGLQRERDAGVACAKSEVKGTPRKDTAIPPCHSTASAPGAIARNCAQRHSRWKAPPRICRRALQPRSGRAPAIRTPRRCSTTCSSFVRDHQGHFSRGRGARPTRVRKQGRRSFVVMRAAIRRLLNRKRSV